LNWDQFSDVGNQKIKGSGKDLFGVTGSVVQGGLKQIVEVVDIGRVEGRSL